MRLDIYLKVRLSRNCSFKNLNFVTPKTAHDPCSYDGHVRGVEIEGKECKLQPLNICGYIQTPKERKREIKEADGFLLVYSITLRSSFEYLSELRKEIMRERNGERFAVVLVGNGADLEEERRVSRQEGEEMGKKWDVPFFETSANCKLNVGEAFVELVRKIIGQREETTKKPKNQGCSLF